MQQLAQARLIRTVVLFSVFAAGLVIGALQSPLAARAQENRRVNPTATLSLIPMRSVPRGGMPVNGCTDVTITAVRPTLDNRQQQDGVLILCERR